MQDKIIPLTDLNSPAESAGATPSEADTVNEIFARRDPVKTLSMQSQIVEALSTVYDPEIPVNIYELGLIYETAVDADFRVGVRMTLTAPACPAAQTLPVEVRNKLQALPEAKSAHVDIVWDPPWSRDMMSDVAKLQLGMF
jgi:FeS assembly SUF system protein